MRKTNAEYLKQILPFFPKAFIYKPESDDPELILEPKNNIYFRLANVYDDLDFEAKMLAFLVRPSFKGMSRYWENYFKRGLFSYFRRTWTVAEITEIYTYLGNDIRRELTRRFIERGFDMQILKKLG